MTTGDSAKIRLDEFAYRDPHHVIAVCQNAVLTYSAGAPNPEYLEGWARTVEVAAAQFPTGLLVLTIIKQHVRAPDDSSRTRIRDAVLRHASAIKAFAYVVEGEGFGASAVRSAVSLISMAARYPFPQKVFGHEADAVPWMLSHATRQDETRAADAAKLIYIANSLREQLRCAAAAG